MENRSHYHKSFKYYNEIKYDIDIEKLFKQLKINYILNNNNYFELLCPYHDDKNPSLTINNNINKKTYGMFQCWSCSCTGNILDFVADRTKQSVEKIYDSIKDKNIIIDKYEKSLKKIIKKKNKNEKIKTVKFPEIVYDIELNSKYYRYLKKREITDKVINDFDLCCCEDGYYQNRVIVPIYHKDKLEGFGARSVMSNTWLKKQEKNLSKKILYPSGFRTNDLFFPDISKAKKDIPIILVEGLFDVLRMYSLGFENIYTTFSNKISNKQKYFLSFFKELILIPDADEGGDAFIYNFKNLRRQNKLFLFELPDGEDPGSVQSDYLDYLYEDCVELYPFRV